MVVALPPPFLDANASAPTLGVAREAAVAAMAFQANPSSPHRAGRNARQVLDEARDHVAAALGAGPKDVFFTSGASEGNRWLADAIADYRTRLSRPAIVWTSPLEHPSLAKPLHQAAAEKAIDLHVIPIGPDGTLDFSKVEAADVVAVTLAHNETGLVPQTEAFLDALPEDVIVIGDASQSLGRLGPVPRRVDAAVCSAHKMGGLTGAGAVFWRGNARRLRPPWSGGGQEGGVRPGTEALVALAAFGAAAAVIERTREQHAALQPVRNRLEDALVTTGGFVRVPNGEGPRLPNTTALCVDGADGEALRMLLDRAGICVGFGAACSALAPEPSPALLALGLSAAQARATIRLSLAPADPDGEQTEPEAFDGEVDRAVEMILDAAQKARS